MEVLPSSDKILPRCALICCMSVAVTIQSMAQGTTKLPQQYNLETTLDYLIRFSQCEYHLISGASLIRICMAEGLDVCPICRHVLHANLAPSLER